MSLLGEHLSKNYDLDLQNLVTHFAKMGGMAEQNLSEAIQSLVETNGELADKVIENDRKINLAEKELDDMVVKILVKRQPAASDLRLIMSVSKSSTDIERIGDESKKIAKMARRAHRDGQQAPLGYHEAHQMAKVVQEMLKNALEAFAKFHNQLAYKVIELDDEIDTMYKSSSRAMMTYIMEDGRYVSKVIDVLWVLRSLERISAHISNIAEQLVYCITGEDVRYPNLEKTLAKANEESIDDARDNQTPDRFENE